MRCTCLLLPKADIAPIEIWALGCVSFLTRRLVATCYDLKLQKAWSFRGHMKRREFITFIGGAAAALQKIDRGKNSTNGPKAPPR